MIVIPTIRHSGSLFVVDHLFGGRDKVVFRHFGEKNFNEVYEYIDGRNCIIPLRRLEKIKTSWQGRQLDPEHLKRDIKLLIAFTEKYKPYFLPIDHDDRDKYLKEINKAFNLNLKTDWPIINRKGHYVPSGDFSIVDQHQWFFDKIYAH